MSMKLKDLMLDLATGDASSNDPYIAEAAGQVNVASAYFEAASMINELAENDDLQVVQEVAKAGLPTNEEGSATLGCTAVKKGMEGLFKVIRETADKVKKQAEKDMKCVLTVAKKYGVSAPSGKEDFAKDFAAPFAKAVAEKKGKVISLSGNQFIKAKYADDIAKSYAKGMCYLLHAYGYDISEVFSDSTVSKEIGKSPKSGECSTLACAADCLADGAKLIKFDDISKDKHYTDTIKTSDLEAVVTDLYILTAVSSAVSDAVKGQDSSAKANVDDLIEACRDSDRKINKATTKIGDNMKEWSSNVQSITNVAAKAFTDSVYAFTEALNKN